jgi:cysteine desulfurase
MVKNDIIYFDHASTTQLDSRVLEEMMPYLTSNYGNASSLHSVGRNAVKGLDNARDEIASIINAKPDEIYFTSGGTESDNWAIKGAFLSRENKNKIVSSSIEHPACLNAIKSIEKQGAKSCLINPKSNGIVDLNDFSSSVDSNTFLTLCMTANNEVGTIQPIKEICNIAHKSGSLFFTDAVQYIGSNNVDVKDLGVDMLSASAHKFYGPKGVGFLYVKKGVKLDVLLNGGHQERQKRAGTSNVAFIVGMASALRLSRQNLLEENNKVLSLINAFIDMTLSQIPCAKLNGDKDMRIASNASITFNGINGDRLLYSLDLNGICASMGSACSAGDITASYVLTNMGLSEKEAFSTLRFSFGKENTLSQVEKCVQILKNEIKKIQA